MAGIQELGRDIEDLTKTPASDALFFSEQERRVLELWDQEQELRLEINLLKAQRDASYISDIANLTDEEVTAQIAIAERDLLTSRSTYQIRQNIINQVLITDPILKSLHASPSTLTSLETRLPPLIHERDATSMLHALLSSRLQKTYLEIAKREQDNIDAMTVNKRLARRMLEMAREVKVEDVSEVRDARVRAQLEKLEGEVQGARREWRVWKSVVGGIVAGSGVDWASDARLLEVVMDEEDEMV